MSEVRPSSQAPAAVRPVIMTVDDDPSVLRAIERDLRSRYGRAYRIVRADSGETALQLLDELRERDNPVALFLIDHQMPRMTGVDFLEQARQRSPEAKRVLLTAYADTNAAIRAINTVKLDHYLLKPWDPPDEQLYPVLDDLLDDWQAGFQPSYRGLQLIGHRWSPEAHGIRDFLARNQVPYRWLDIERDSEARQLVPDANGDTCWPALLLSNGTRLDAPSISEIATALGLRTHAERQFYDLVIAGGGPAGLAAAVYGASEGLRTVMIERKAPGGQAGMSSRIENYLGFPSGLSGADLARRAVAQAARFGVEILSPQAVTGLRVEDPYRIVTLADGSEIGCLALVVATGVSYRRLDVPGIERLTGAGVFYGGDQAEAVECQDGDIFVVGGANSAGQSALYIARYARRVTIVVRGESLTDSMSHYLVQQIADTPNIDVMTRTVLAEAHGETSLEAVTICNQETGATTRLLATGVFIYIGAAPHTDWLDGMIERDDRGYIKSGPALERDDRGRWRKWPLSREPHLLETCVPGVFVAGDVRCDSVKRVASSVGEGAIAVSFVHQYLAQSKV